MNIVLLQAKLEMKEIEKLLEEFPQYLFLSFNEASYKNLRPEDWAGVEILFGSRLTPGELEQAKQLRWVHSPTPKLNRLCLKEIEEQENILVSFTKEENVVQMGEFVMGGILAFAKNLFHWDKANKFPGLIWDSKWRDKMWTLKGKLLVQIGLGRVGTEIAKKGKEFGMKVYGVRDKSSFHPNCDKVIAFKDVNSILPAADVVSVCMRRTSGYENWFDRSKLKLLKQDSILSISGSSSVVNEEELASSTNTEKLRGIILDASYLVPIPVSSKLWKMPNILITPDVGPRPKSQGRLSFSIFRFNLRQYIHNNFTDMKNLM